jgi:hypothetical protein
MVGRSRPGLAAVRAKPGRAGVIECRSATFPVSCRGGRMIAPEATCQAAEVVEAAGLLSDLLSDLAPLEEASDEVDEELPESLLPFDELVVVVLDELLDRLSVR